jgi:hypothetical protein
LSLIRRLRDERTFGFTIPALKRRAKFSRRYASKSAVSDARFHSATKKSESEQPKLQEEQEDLQCRQKGSQFK